MIHLRYFFLGIWELRWKILAGACVAAFFSAFHLWPEIAFDVLFCILMGTVTVAVIYGIYRLGRDAATKKSEQAYKSLVFKENPDGR